MTTVTEAEFGNAVLAQHKPVVAYFWATWCTRCRQFGPIVEKFADQHASTVTVVKVDCDQNPQIVADYGIMQAPTIVIFRDGKLVEMLPGVRSLDELTAAIADVIQ